MRSLQNRLSWGLMLSLILLLTLQWAVVTYAIGRLTEAQLLSRMQQESLSLLAGVNFDAAGALQVEPQHVSAVYQRPFSGHYYLVLTEQHKQASRSLWDAELAVAPLPPGEEAQLHLAGPERQPLLVMVQGYRKQGHAVTIVLAEDMRPLQAGLTRFQWIYALVSISGLALLLLVQRIIVAGALRPLAAVQQSMARLGRGEAEQVEARGPAEVMPLIDELNRLLAGMDRKTRRSREALGNLAHALKTRLTLLNQTAERPEVAAHPALRSAIYEATDSMGDIIERELRRARLVGHTHPGRRVNLPVEIAQLVHTLRLIHVGKAVNITWEVTPEARFFGDREDLLELLGNLLDNACKWCRGSVSLTVSAQGGATFVVEDDGPGCPAEEMETLTQRGFRADESRPGSGLGLAIARDIVESYDGQLRFGRSAALGGLRVEAALPHSAPAGAE